MFILLTACSSGTDSPPQGEGAPVEDTGARMYSGNCIPCHQPDAHGIPGVYPSLAGSPVVLGDPRELALWVMRGRRPSGMPAGRYSGVMMQFDWMKPADAAALFTYVRSNFGNEAAAVDAAMVSRALSEQP